MKYKIGDKVEYYSREETQTGTIIDIQDCESPYIINTPSGICSSSAFYESIDTIKNRCRDEAIHIDKTDYIIRKIKEN